MRRNKQMQEQLRLKKIEEKRVMEQKKKEA
jgi:hypothetical protein